eukprot:s4869_g11.t1
MHCTHPTGLPWLQGQAREMAVTGNLVAAFCREVIAVCESKGVHWWLEHPDSSFLWRLEGFEKFRGPSSSHTWRCDMCVFGAPWRKRTKVATTLELQGERHFCRCTTPHVILRGRALGRHGDSMTNLAKAYPRGFAELPAASAAKAAGWRDLKGKLQAARCARCSHRRIGETRNPGPRRKVTFREADLESRPLQSAATLIYEDRLWLAFIAWCSTALSDAPLLF